LEHPVDRTYPYRHITRPMVEEALGKMCGERLQTPPVYSAKKIDGQRAYEYAREGTHIEMRQAAINVYAIELLEFDLPRVRLRIDCSKGTYIRSIAMELGKLLQSGAHLTSLRRTRSGQYTADQAWTVEQIAKSFHRGETK
ncbi:MAG: tRNA pseudouridine(55) synthase, partial [Alistipes sp.]|nr:tRNA pseudouridine(55) synthase [Alistipes sp.]